MTAGYGTDLAVIHHGWFGDLAREAAAVVAADLARRNVTSGLVVDLGSGSGILAAEFTRRGFDVLGIDISPAMVRIARQEAPRARFRVGSIVDADLPPCVAVTAIGEIVNYAFDARLRARRLPVLFRRVYQALVPGGLFLLDTAGPGRAGPRRAREQFHDHPAWAMHLVVREAGDRLTRTMTTFVRERGAEHRRVDEVHTLRLYDPGYVEAGLRGAGFRVRRHRRYGTRALPRGLTAFSARKP
ncbi:MAG: class I SAM-dependent methyltransferase [Actinobacteria bacterium]|nr:class I SAM-dependent methyltransferase [Actinomycetota bacterium]